MRLWTILLCVTIVSCDKVDKRRKFINEDGLLVKRWFYPDSVNLKRERTYLNDSTIHGYAKEYFENGQLYIFKEYKEGIKNGREINYYDNGQVRVGGVNFNGHRDGLWVWYDSLGNVQKKTRYGGRVRCGQHEYFEPFNGKYYLNECYCFSPEGDGAWHYHATYDSLGNKKSEEGFWYPILVFEHDPYDQNLNDSLIVEIFLCPCRSTSDVTVTLLDSLTRNALDKITINGEVDFFTYRHKLKQKGILEFKVEQDTSIDFHSIYVY